MVLISPCAALQAELAERNVTAAYKAVRRFVHGEKLTLKKKRSARRAGSP
jgi:transposase